MEGTSKNEETELLKEEAPVETLESLDPKGAGPTLEPTLGLIEADLSTKGEPEKKSDEKDDAENCSEQQMSNSTAGSRTSTSLASSGRFKAGVEVSKAAGPSIYKGGSEVSTTQADSAYGSLGPISVTATSHAGQSISRSGSPSAHSTQPGKQDPDIFKNLKQDTFETFEKQQGTVLPSEKKAPLGRQQRKPKKASRVNLRAEENVKQEDSGKVVPPPFNSILQESKAAKVATLSQALGYVDEFRKIQASKQEPRRGPEISELNDLASNLLEASQGSQPVSPENQQDNLQEETIVQHEKNTGHGFCVAVSLLDGMVKQTTASLTNILGYPKDMWVGRSVINFVHPLDRETFIKQVTENIGLILRENVLPKSKESKKETISKSGSFFCRIRIYNGLKSGYSIKERKTRYSPFKLSVCFTEMDSKSSSSKSPDWVPEVRTGSSFLILTAIPLMSAFYESLEDMSLRPGNHTFITKHNATCIFSFIDDSAIPYIGYLPQEIHGESIFDFIHCMDLSVLKDMFEVAMLEQGKPCRTENIRFKVRNGGYIEVNSRWSCFINPWSRQLEFVHGKHTVVMGPLHPDVFAVLPMMDAATGQKQHLAIQEEIRNILKKTVMKNNFVDAQGKSSSKTKKELSTFMGTLLEEVARSETIKLGRTAKKIGDVVIENISPLQSDSSETPPSYNQLTYNENLTRFFNSQPKTLSSPEREENEKISDSGVSQNQGKSSEDSQASKEKTKAGKKQHASLRKHMEDGGRSGRESGGSGEQAGTGSGSGNGNSYTLQTGLSAGQVQSGQDECMMSVDGSNSGLGSGGSRGTSMDAYTPPVLTIELLANHNMDMERKMLDSYKQAKRSGDIRFLKEHRINLSEKGGLKRLPVQKLGLSPKIKERSIPPSKSLQPSPVFSPDNPANPMWRSYVENESTINNTSSPKHGHEGFMGFNQANMMQRGAPTSFPAFSNIIGLSNMYVPFRPDSGQAVRYDQDHMAKRVQIQNMQARYGSPAIGLPGQVQGMIGVGLASGSSQAVVPTSPGSLAAPVSSPSAAPDRNNVKYAQSASVKVEPGSAIGSIATTSVRDKDVHSPSEVFSPGGGVATPGGGVRSPPTADQAKAVLKGQSGGDVYQSTHSSSLYSFLNTSEEDGSMTSAAEEPKEAKHVARPVLAEPFWNEKVVMTPELEMQYQLEVRDPKDVLQADLNLLESMVQHADVQEQILELFSNDEDRTDLKEMLTETEQWLLETTSLSSVDEASTDDFNTDFNDAVIRNKMAKKRAYLENLNIFMGAEAPFPMPHSPRLTNKMAWKAFNFSDCSSSDESEHNG